MSKEILKTAVTSIKLFIRKGNNSPAIQIAFI